MGWKGKASLVCKKIFNFLVLHEVENEPELFSMLTGSIPESA